MRLRKNPIELSFTSYKVQNVLNCNQLRCKKLLRIKDFSNYRVTIYRWLTVNQKPHRKIGTGKIIKNYLIEVFNKFTIENQYQIKIIRR